MCQNTEEISRETKIYWSNNIIFNYSFKIQNRRKLNYNPFIILRKSIMEKQLKGNKYLFKRISIEMHTYANMINIKIFIISFST